jgi:hypothetical protein
MKNRGKYFRLVYGTGLGESAAKPGFSPNKDVQKNSNRNILGKMGKLNKA